MALDRRRVGERLQASLAGLQELRLLRERHREMVRRLLETGEPEQGSPGQTPATGGRQQPHSLGSSEGIGSPDPDLQQEADLSLGGSEPPAGVGQQSTPLGPDPLCPAAGPPCPGAEPSRGAGSAAEAGSGAPLAAKAPVPCRAATTVRGEQGTEPAGGSGELRRMESGTQLAEGPLDNLESDSRPSSGFYDVTDSASCSLSNSCTSVYSECPSGSRWSIQSLSQLPRSNSHWNRPRSIDDSTVRLLDLRSQRLAGPGALTAEGYGPGGYARSKATQRPVSTGDLISFRRYPGADPAARPISCCYGDWGPRGTPDAKYQCDLVSRNGTEVYHYPSPLHAVALQSPLFTAPPARGGCPLQPGAEEGLAPAGADPPPRAPSRGRLDKYISSLVLRFRCRPAPGKAELASSHAKSLSLSSVYSQGSSTGGAAPPLLSPTGGWKLRRRISTCCPAGERARFPERRPSEGGSEASSSSSSSPSPLEAAFPGPAAFPSPPAEAPLYRGKHLHRELVRCPPSGEGATGGRTASNRSRSEMSLDLAGCQRPEASAPCGPEGRPSPAKRRQRKWTSVLEIPGPSSSSSGGRCRLRKPGLLGQAQAFLSRRHRAFSSESPPSAPLGASREELWTCRCRGAETLPRPAVAAETRFHRSKSFKELRRKVQLSIRPWSLKVNNPSK